MRFRPSVPERHPVRENTDNRGPRGQATLLRGADGEIWQAGYHASERLLPAHRRDHGLRNLRRANDRQGNGAAAALRTVASERPDQNTKRAAVTAARLGHDIIESWSRWRAASQYPALRAG